MNKPAEFEASQPESQSPKVPFGSNDIRLTAPQWIASLVIAVAILAAAPRWWSRIEPLNAAADYRIPYALSEDYWTYGRRFSQAVSRHEVVVIGDSVIWGEYVEAEETLSHYLSEETGSAHFFNGGVNGAHPLSLSGLVQYYTKDLRGARVIVQCNLLWMSSPERDLQVTKQIPFNHPDLVPQFAPWIPCYKATVTDRLGICIDRTLTFRSLAKHWRIAAFDGADLPRWTIEHPWSNPLTQTDKPVAAAAPARPPSVPWTDRGLRPQNLPWIDLETSLQWGAVKTLVRTLAGRDTSVFVLVNPLNEHLLTPTSRARYHVLVEHVDRWLSDQGVAHAVPTVLPSDEYADASHPLAGGYARLARGLAADGEFQGWLNQ